MELCNQTWDFQIICTEVKRMVYVLAVIDSATDLKMNFGKKLPLSDIIAQGSFKADVEKLKKELIEDQVMDADAFFNLVFPEWKKTVQQLKTEETKNVSQENFDAAIQLARHIEQLEQNSPHSLKKRLMTEEARGVIMADCDDLVGKIMSLSNTSENNEFNVAYKRLRYT